MQKRKQMLIKLKHHLTIVSKGMVFSFLFLLGLLLSVTVVKAEEIVPEESVSQLSKEIIDAGLVEVPGEETKTFLESLEGKQITAFGFIDPKLPEPNLEINVENLKIVSQKENLLKISFDAVNKNPYARVGIRYGVFLNRVAEEDITPESLPYYGETRQIYTEKLNFSSNSKISKAIEYIAPSYLSGEYFLSVEFYKDNGLYLGGQKLDGAVTLDGGNNTLEIVPSSCKIEVEGGIEGKSYSPNGEASINPQSEKIFGVCNVINHSDNQVTFTQGFKIYRESILKGQPQATRYNEAEFQFEPKEESLVVFPLPTDLESQIYDVEIFLNNGKEMVSNSVIMRYFLQGASATIQDVIFNLPVFSAGKESEAVLFLAFYPGQSKAERSLNCDLTLRDKTDGQICGQASRELKIDEAEFKIKKDFNYAIDHEYLLDYLIPISKDCQNPVVSIVAKDKNGKVLAQKEIEIFQGTNQKSFAENKKAVAMVILVMVSILVLAIFLFVIKRKK